MSIPDYTLRTIKDDDMPFLRKVYASTRQMELDLTDWSEEQKEQFLAMQFNAQHSHYQQHYCDAQFNIIEIDSQDAGRLYRLDQPHDIRIIDITILPEYRNRGIGSLVLNDIIEHGDKNGTPITIHVELNNPAMSLYRRLGFEPISSEGVYLLMEKTVATTTNDNPC